MIPVSSISNRYNPPGHDRSVKYSPYAVLWLRVITRAAFDFALWKDSSDFRTKKCAIDAERWLFQESAIWHSFDNICDIFHFPKEKLREWARSLTRDQVRKMEFREREGKDPFEPETPVLSLPEQTDTDGDDQ